MTHICVTQPQWIKSSSGINYVFKKHEDEGQFDPYAMPSKNKHDDGQFGPYVIPPENI